MLCPETNDLAISIRLLGMAARIGNDAIPEDIANEAQTARFELAECEDSNLKDRAEAVARGLVAYATASEGYERTFAAIALEIVTANLRGAVVFGKLYGADYLEQAIKAQGRAA